MRQTTSAEIAIWPSGRMPARAAVDLDARALADWEDLAAACQGNQDAFARLVERHEPRLFALCRSLLGDAALAEEATQEVFLRLFRRGGSYRRGGRLYRLLYRMATNWCLNQLRRRRIVRFLSLGDGGANEVDDAPRIALRADGIEDERPSSERQLESAQEWRAVQQAIDALAPGQRAVVVLVRLHGLSYREAAEVLGTTVRSVESRLVRAMKALRRQHAAAEASPGSAHQAAR